MKKRTHVTILLVLALGLCTSVQADLAITNGDFEVGAGPSTPDVNDWYDNSTANFWENAWQSNDSWITPNGTQVVVFCAWNTAAVDPNTGVVDPLTGSYLYQSIGTSAGESSITIGFDWGSPDDVAAGRHDALTVSVLASDGSFVPNDANDVLGAAGVTLLDSASFDYVALGTDGEIFPAVATLDLSGANEGDEIFLRFNNYAIEAGADPWPVLDNVQIIPEVAPVGPKIIWVTETVDRNEDGIQDDQQWIDYLTAAGYELDVQPDHWLTLGDDQDPNDANDYVAELNAGDLVIISRTASSGGYASDANEVAAWASVTTPIMSLSAWHVRDNRLKWVSSTTVNRTLDTYLWAMEPDHPVFDGVALEDDLVEAVTIDGFPDGYQGNCVIGDLNVGNGTLIGQTFYDEMFIAEFPAGVEAYEGAGVVQAGPRFLLCAGTENASTTANLIPQGAWNLTEAGEQIFANAIKYLLPPTLTITPDAPELGDADISNLVGCSTDANNVGTGVEPPYTNDVTTYIAHDRGGQGQTFLTGDNAGGYLLTGVWVKHVTYSGADPDQTWYQMAPGSAIQIRVTDPSAADTDGFVLAKEVYNITGEEENALPATQTNDQTGTGLWFNVTLGIPVVLSPNTEYGFDLTSLSGLSGNLYFETDGIRDDIDGGNPYPDGTAYVTGANGAADNTMTVAPGDHVFVVQLSAL